MHGVAVSVPHKGGRERQRLHGPQFADLHVTHIDAPLLYLQEIQREGGSEGGRGSLHFRRISKIPTKKTPKHTQKEIQNANAHTATQKPCHNTHGARPCLRKTYGFTDAVKGRIYRIG